MRILIVEDEANAAQYLKKGLSEEGFIIDCFDNGRDGLFQLLFFMWSNLPQSWHALSEIKIARHWQ